jgi:hypothetical protein
MTPENMAKHRNDPNMPFWLMLKEGYDHFDVTGQPPSVNVCDHRYIFDAVPANGRSFIPSAQCPPMSMPEPIRIALTDREAKDNARMLDLATRLDGKEESKGAEAIRLAMATPSTADRSVPLPMSVATAPISLEPATTASVSPGGLLPQPENPPAAVASAPASATTDIGFAPTVAPAVATTESTPVRVPSVRPVSPAPVAVAKAPAAEPVTAPAADSGFLPVPELRQGEVGSSAPASAETATAATAAGEASDTATLEERMLAGSAPADPTVANSYASASQEDQGLTGMVLKLIRKQQDEPPAQ